MDDEIKRVQMHPIKNFERLCVGEKWLETGNPFVEVGMSESQLEWLKADLNQRLSKQVESLMSDVH